MDLSEIPQLDGHDNSLNVTENESRIPVHISIRNSHTAQAERLPPVRKVLKRNSIIMQSIELPIIMNLNPRSLYNKVDDLKLVLEQYEADCVCISESWEREM